MFRWHSTVVEPRGTCGATTAASAAASTSAPASAPKQHAGPSVEESCIKHAFDICQSVGARAQRGSDGKILDPKHFLKSMERSGVRFGPQGGGTLLAIADVRRPTFEEFVQCARAPGSVISKPVPGAGSRGRGLGHLHGGSMTESQARGSARGGQLASSRGRGRAGFGVQGRK